MAGFELINDIHGERRLIEQALQAQGCGPEHNFNYFASQESEGVKCIFIKNGKYGLQATYEPLQKKWTMIGEPVAPKEAQPALIREILDFLTEKGKLAKFVAELETGQKKLLGTEIETGYKVHSASCVLYWPVYDMKSWTGDELKGKAWKKVRNMLNRVRKSHSIDIVDSATIEKEVLKDIIRKWAEMRRQAGLGINRKDSNRIYYHEYMKLIDLGFDGCKFAQTAIVDGKPASITAGWEIPNSNGTYYSALGIYDLTTPYLGVFLNWNDLAMLKKAGYSKVDFGGSPKPLLEFKKKFRPAEIYRTHIFSITKK